LDVTPGIKASCEANRTPIFTEVKVLFKKIPEITPISHTGKESSMRGFCGHYLILYFYPKANTPGCTREAQGFTALLPKFQRLDASVVGVSPDRPETQARFVETKALQVTMLSDPDKTLAREFGVVKKSGGILRSTFLIDRTGIVQRSLVSSA
jgi:peroxiredoxin Q/BCP